MTYRSLLVMMMVMMVVEVRVTTALVMVMVEVVVILTMVVEVEVRITIAVANFSSIACLARAFFLRTWLLMLTTNINENKAFREPFNPRLHRPLYHPCNCTFAHLSPERQRWHW